MPVVRLPKTLVFVEYRPSGFLSEIQRLFRHAPVDARVDVRVHEGDIMLLPLRNSAFVSAGDGTGSMDGGVDFAYSRIMFPGCERALLSEIGSLGRWDGQDRPRLPVGSAIGLRHPDASLGALLIVAPATSVSHNVSGTCDAYRSFSAALHVFSARARVDALDTMVCPAICCRGRMDPRESARQIFSAFADVVKKGDRMNTPTRYAHDDADSDDDKYVHIGPIFDDRHESAGAVPR